MWFVITFTYSNRSTRIDPLDMVRFANDEEKNVHRCIRIDDIVFGINCEMDNVINNHDWCNSEPITFKAKYIANVTKELDGKFFSGTEMRIKRINHFVKKYATTREVFNTISEVALLYQANDERLIGVEVVIE